MRLSFNTSYLPFLPHLEFVHLFLFFLKFPFFIFSKILKYHRPDRGITFFIFKHTHIDLRYTLDKVFCGFSSRPSSKTLSTRQISGNAPLFFAGPLFFSYPPFRREGLVELYIRMNNCCFVFNCKIVNFKILKQIAE